MEYKGKIVGIEMRSGKKHNAKILGKLDFETLIYDNNAKETIVLKTADIKNINCGPVRVKVS